VDFRQGIQEGFAFGPGETRGDLLLGQPPLRLDRFPQHTPRVGGPEPDETVVPVVGQQGHRRIDIGGLPRADELRHDRVLGGEPTAGGGR